MVGKLYRVWWRDRILLVTASLGVGFELSAPQIRTSSFPNLHENVDPFISGEVNVIFGKGKV